MKLVVGLGNPGEKYANNRHNVGHMVVDALQTSGAPKGVVVKKTDVFMNESGRAVKKLVDFYKVSPEDLYIVYDDLDIRLGEYKISKGKGPRVHNGVNSVEESLGTSDFWHVRMGIDNRNSENRTPGEAYVLQDFDDEEKKILEGVIDKVVKELAAKQMSITDQNDFSKLHER